MRQSIRDKLNIIKKKRVKNADWKFKEVVLLIGIVIVMVIMDVIFLYQSISNNNSEREYANINAAETMEYLLRNSVEYAAQLATNLSMNRELDSFLETEYTSPADYYEGYRTVMGGAQIAKMITLKMGNLEIYADNETLTNGGGIYRMSQVTDKEWYRYFVDSKKDALLFFIYEPSTRNQSTSQRKLYYVRWMKYYPGSKYEKLCKIEINYGTLCNYIENSLYDIEVYLCQQDNIVISSAGNNNRIEPYMQLTSDNIQYRRDVSFSGNDFSLVVPKRAGYLDWTLRRNTGFTVALILINVLLPIIFIRLMHMIQEGKIKEQEMDIARQNAELLALHSQINPHFLFNALESIRMHSLLRGEEETAEMVEKLAIIERKNADWNEDETTIEDEMIFVDAYLKLQQYRFGERLSYEINIADECAKRKIPRLTMVTFVENACVHGIEGKSAPGWIFINVDQDDEFLSIEIEDTGGGMEEEEVSSLKDKMINASLEKLRTKGRIGIVNACLRLKMFTDNKVIFDIDSERGVGTTIQVKIPRECFEGK